MPLGCMSSTASGAAGAAGGTDMTMLIFPILLIVVFILLIIVPNKRKEKQFKNMLGNLRVGDMIKTIGGFYGKVVSIKEDLITIECGPDKTKLVLAKGAIASVEGMEEGKEIPAKTDDKKDGKSEEAEEKADDNDKKEDSKGSKKTK